MLRAGRSKVQAAYGSDLQGALIIFNALKQLTEVAFAKTPTPTSLLHDLFPIRLFDREFAAYSLNDFKKQCRPVAHRFCKDLKQDTLNAQ